MNTRSILLGAILLAALTPVLAQAPSGTQDMPMKQNMQDMPMYPQESNMKAVDCMQMHQGMQGMQGKDMKSGQGTQGMPMGQGMPCAQQTTEGTGVVEAIDTAKGTVTIRHEAIASIRWPAMTMTFKAEPPRLLQGIAVGERVNFSLHPAGMHSTVTAITRAR